MKPLHLGNTAIEKHFFLIVLSILISGLLKGTVADAARVMERLDRGVVTVSLGSNDVYIGWRLLGTDPENIAFNVYRDSIKANTDPIAQSTNYLDTNGNSSSLYQVVPVIDGIEQDGSEPVAVWANQYMDIPLQVPEGVTTPDGVTCSYSPNDASVGDLDGDGQYEIVLKWDPSNSQDNSISGYTGNVYLDAYELDGTFLWRIDLGINIRAGAHYTQFIVYDLDSDGYAEVACRTSDGTVDGTGVVIGDPAADYRRSDGYVLTGSEYLTIFNGQTGEARVSTDFYPNRVDVTQWGDNFGNRCDRFLAGVAYVDGQYPTLIMARGYYGPKSGYSARNEIAAYNWRDNALSQVWYFKAHTSGPNANYIGQGNHNLSIADVDGDGFDEIIYGACAIDHDGSGLYSTGYGHGDAMHCSDLDPARPGLEVFTIHEGSGPGATFRDAGTGQILWETAGADVGRGVSADIDPTFPGAECWGFGGLRSCTGEIISTSSPSSTNFVVLWDGDLLSELLNSNVITKHGGSNLLTASGCSSNNSTKSTPCLSADILGDWREEVIWRTSDNQSLRIYTTTYETDCRIYTLMHDSHYRISIAWQNVAYNQPPHTGYFLGDGMSAPPMPDITFPGDHGLYGDFNGDKRVDMFDLTYFVDFLWLGDFWSDDNCTLTSELDLNEDCSINLHEYTAMAANWTGPDKTAPAVPTGLTAVPGNSRITLNWSDNRESDLSGYNIYRSTTSNSGYTLLNASLLSESYYLDNDVTNDTIYYYVVTAMDSSSNESAQSTEASAVPRVITTITIQENEAGYVGVYDGSVDSNNAGYTGTGFVNTNNAVDQYIEWTVEAGQTGSYDLQWRYANGASGNRTAAVSVNDNILLTNVNFESTGSWTTWDVTPLATVTLDQGINTIRLIAETGDGLANIDWIEVTGAFP